MTALRGVLAVSATLRALGTYAPGVLRSERFLTRIHRQSRRRGTGALVVQHLIPYLGVKVQIIPFGEQARRYRGYSPASTKECAGPILSVSTRSQGAVMVPEGHTGGATPSPKRAPREVSWNSIHMDAIRGAAALVVMLGHNRDLFFASLSGTAKQNTAVPQQTASGVAPAKESTSQKITIGNEMVIVFFVLSGYLVGGSVLRSLSKRRWSWPDYLLKRMTRLWVVLIPALLFGFALDWFGLHHLGGPRSIYSGPPPQLIVPPTVAARITPVVFFWNVFFVQGIFVQLAGTNDSLWSLANEFWYYLAFPALLLAFASWLSPVKRGISLVLFVLIALLCGPAIGDLFPIWAAGALLTKVPRKLSKRAALLMGSILALSFPLACIFIRRLAVDRRIAQYAVAGFFMLLLWVLLHQDWPSRAGIYRTSARSLSRFSYTLYLVHVPVAVLLVAIVNPEWHVLPRSPQNLLLFLGINLIVVAVASLFYMAVEKQTDRVRDVLLTLPPFRGRSPATLHAGNEVR